MLGRFARRASIGILTYAASAAFLVAVVGAALWIGRWQIQNSETNTIEEFQCDSPQMGGQCDTAGSLANFFVELCGRAAVSAWSGLRGGGRLWLPGIEHEPGAVMAEVALGCGHPEVRFRFPPETSLQEAAEAEEYLDKGTDTYRVFVDWSSREITTAQAKALLKR